MENFSRAGLSGPGELAWEQAAWQAGQAAAFAQLFLEAQQSAQAHHPGIYFQLAANYAISRSFLLKQCFGIRVHLIRMLIQNMFARERTFR
jgi:hypothetical protein